jgi:hypothetical protein
VRLPVRTQQRRRRDPGPGPPLHEVDQDLERPGLDHGIRVQKEHVRRRRQHPPPIAGSPVADVPPPFEELQPARFPAQDLDRAVRAAVVHDDTPEETLQAGLAKRRERSFHRRRRLVGDDDDGHAGPRRPTSPLALFGLHLHLSVAVAISAAILG